MFLADSAGRIIRETKVASEPDALIEHLTSLGLALKRIGLEASPLSQWLYEGLTKAGFDVALLETGQVKAALSTMIIKTDRNDARASLEIDRKITPCANYVAGEHRPLRQVGLALPKSQKRVLHEILGCRLRSHVPSYRKMQRLRRLRNIVSRSWE